jgi:hypothetical protein
MKYPLVNTLNRRAMSDSVASQEQQKDESEELFLCYRERFQTSLRIFSKIIPDGTTCAVRRNFRIE